MTVDNHAETGCAVLVQENSGASRGLWVAPLGCSRFDVLLPAPILNWMKKILSNTLLALTSTAGAGVLGSWTDLSLYTFTRLVRVCSQTPSSARVRSAAQSPSRMDYAIAFEYAVRILS